MIQAASTECHEHCWCEVKTCTTATASVRDVAANGLAAPGDINAALALWVVIRVWGTRAGHVCIVDAHHEIGCRADESTRAQSGAHSRVVGECAGIGVSALGLGCWSGPVPLNIVNAAITIGTNQLEDCLGDIDGAWIADRTCIHDLGLDRFAGFIVDVDVVATVGIGVWVGAVGHVAVIDGDNELVLAIVIAARARADAGVVVGHVAGELSIS